MGAEANANVAANLLEDKLGYTVELVKIDEFEQFPALASGDLDATLEVWPSVTRRTTRSTSRPAPA